MQNNWLFAHFAGRRLGQGRVCHCFWVPFSHRRDGFDISVGSNWGNVERCGACGESAPKNNDKLGMHVFSSGRRANWGRTFCVHANWGRTFRMHFRTAGSATRPASRLRRAPGARPGRAAPQGARQLHNSAGHRVERQAHRVSSAQSGRATTANRGCTFRMRLCTPKVRPQRAKVHAEGTSPICTPRLNKGADDTKRAK